ncbi:hypothetical protein BDW59DRAFT_16797 [Aspergillus cavernicola]|uniref:Zn(2)-C6 fungal-type domain-containing protein n=1 Tax=Aspergillus cavernicola TaxID=176166 RepID=A0ABR4HJ72_9EURO
MAPSAHRAFQTTFQVTLPDRPIGAPYHARRTHKKSRKGCLVCKQRRVKCDERKPACLRCENYGASCIYPPTPKPSQTNSSPENMTVSPSNRLSSLSISDMVTRVRDAMSGELAFAPRVIGNQDEVLKIAMNSFQFFLKSSTDTIGPPLIRQVMRREMIHVAFDNPYLMYTILGCGILHMNRICPGSESRELAEAYFWQQALGLYSRALQCNVDDKNVNGLISACMLMGITSIIPPKFEIQDSWVFSGRHSDLNWLAIQGGLNAILKVAAKYVPGSIWGTPFGQNNKFETKLFQYEIKQGREGLHPALADLCGIDEFTSAETSPYYFPLKVLSPYLELEANAQNAAHCTTWMGRLDAQFVNLCRQRDPRALVLLAYWMGLMCTLSKWQPWVEGRVRQECIAVCIYLESMEDPVILPFLEFPACAAGYTLLSY